jgi:hypothetical protein
LEDTTTTASNTQKTNNSSSIFFETSLVKAVVTPVEQVNSVILYPVAKISKKATKLALSPFLGSKYSQKKSKVTEQRPGEKNDDPLFDKGLESMTVVVNKTLRKVTLDDVEDVLFFRIEDSNVWAHIGNQESPVLGEWEERSKDEPFVDPWSNESYSHKRTISFHSPRGCTSFFDDFSSQDDSTVMKVQQTQYKRREPSKFVFAATETSTGAYYSKSVKVFRRLVVTEIEKGMLSFKAGVFVMFTRPSLMEDKVRAMVIHDTRKRHMEMTAAFRASLADKVVKRSVLDQYKFKSVETEPSFFLNLMDKIRLALPFTQSLQDNPEFHDVLQSLRAKVNMVEALLEDRETNSIEDLNFYDSQLLVAHEALNNVMTPYL